MTKVDHSTFNIVKYVKRWVFFSLLGCLLLLATPLNLVAGEASSGKKPLEKSFPNSEKCKRCHLRVFEEWEASAQSRSTVTIPSINHFSPEMPGKQH